MKVLAQTLNEIVLSLRPLVVDWKDDVARRVIDTIDALPIKRSYDVGDVRQLLGANFDDGLLICRLFLGLSKDQFTGAMNEALKKGGYGIKRYQKEPNAYLDGLASLGLLEAMAEQTNRTPKWNDTLVERLRSGRGSAISGQKRGRAVEDFAEKIIKQVFGSHYDPRCTFIGPRDKKAKCDFAIPSKGSPNIVVEAKGYGATGSKMTDIIGDIESIIAAKRKDTALLFFTDGITWKQRTSDLKKLVDFQNCGDITRIYTYAMASQFKTDLLQLKREYSL